MKEIGVPGENRTSDSLVRKHRHARRKLREVGIEAGILSDQRSQCLLKTNRYCSTRDCAAKTLLQIPIFAADAEDLLPQFDGAALGATFNFVINNSRKTQWLMASIWGNPLTEVPYAQLQ